MAEGDVEFGELSGTTALELDQVAGQDQLLAAVGGDRLTPCYDAPSGLVRPAQRVPGPEKVLPPRSGRAIRGSRPVSSSFFSSARDSIGCSAFGDCHKCVGLVGEPREIGDRAPGAGQPLGHELRQRPANAFGLAEV